MFICVFAMASQTTESQGLNFSEETHGYNLGDDRGFNKLKVSCFNSIFKIPRATPDTSSSQGRIQGGARVSVPPPLYLLRPQSFHTFEILN